MPEHAEFSVLENMQRCRSNYKLPYLNYIQFLFYIHGSVHRDSILIFTRRIKSHLPFAGIIRSSPYSPRFQDKG